MAQYLDISGNRYGMLTAIRIHHKGKWNEYWECKCDCGKEVIRTKSTLQKGLSTSCGCDKYKKVSLSNKKPNKFEIMGDYVVGITNNNEQFIFDIEDYDLVSQYTWHKMSCGYFYHKDNKQCFLLHRFIMNPPSGTDIDHINHDKGDNRRRNLRLASRSQNLVNKRYKNKTGYRGVVKLPSGRFVAQIGGEYIGSYDTAQQAHNAYMLEATKKYGDFLYQDGNNLISDNQYAEKIS